MKQPELIALGLAGLAVFLILRAKPGTSRAAAKAPKPNAPGAAEILDNGRPYSNGWRYFDNGTAIDPLGNYYFQGSLVYSSGRGLLT